MDTQRLITLFIQLDGDGSLGLGKASETTREGIKSFRLPTALEYVITSYWPQTPGRGQIGYYSILTTGEIRSEINRSFFLPHHILEIGNSGTGDTLVVDIDDSEHPTYIIAHEHICDKDTSPREKMLMLTESLCEFAQRAVDGVEVPGDFWEALQQHDPDFDPLDW